MKGKLITGRAVVVDDFIKQGIVKGHPTPRKYDKNSRYDRQHKTKVSKK